MVHYPEELKKLQSHIEEVVDNNCLPIFKDIHNMPRVLAIVKEMLRWQSAAPQRKERPLQWHNHSHWHQYPPQPVGYLQRTKAVPGREGVQS